MSTTRGPSAFPYKQTPRNLRRKPIPKPTTPPPLTSRRAVFYLASGGFAAYTSYLASSLISPSTSPLPAQDADVANRYNTTASHFDQDVSCEEAIWGIARLRRRLGAQARGHVLEVSVGTGRNGIYYDLDRVKSLAFVDQSGPMIGEAKKKWDLLHPGYEHCSFHEQSAMDPLPASTVPTQGFTTVVETMGVCSTPDPAAMLAHLGTLVEPVEGRILLLEHGRSYYGWMNWILDKSAAKHADKHGCWYNRDIGKVLKDSGLVVEKMERSQFGTVWLVEARPDLQKKSGGVKRGEEDENGKRKGKGKEGFGMEKGQ